MVNNLFSKTINFDAKKHKYSVGKGKNKIVFDGVTTFIKSFFDQFDAKAQARRSNKNPNSKYYRMGVRKILSLWKQKGQDSAAIGTAVHGQVQEYILKQRTLVDDSHSKSYGAFTFYDSVIAKYPGCAVYPEQIVFSEELRLAGTVDLVIDIGGGEVIIVDWKTSETIDKEGYAPKNGKPKIGIGVCSDLADCNYNHYSLQLSTYAYILEKEYAVSVSKLFLVHLTDQGHYVHAVPYLKDKVHEMLAWRKQNVDAN